jgi:hypothetical protein
MSEENGGESIHAWFPNAKKYSSRIVAIGPDSEEFLKGKLGIALKKQWHLKTRAMQGTTIVVL